LYASIHDRVNAHIQAQKQEVAQSIFPEEYLAQIEVAEEAGSIPETCKRLALQHSEEAGRQLSIIFYLMGGAVWLCTAGFIIFIIARMYGSYLGMLGV
jgi:type II secretory pathway component PulF